MEDLEKLHTLQFDLVKLIISKRATLTNFKDLRANLILTNNLIEQKRKKQEVATESIEAVENYISYMRKGR